MATISNTDITQASSLTTSTDGKYTVTGSGIFDDLMEAANAHLSAQFNLGRITGKDYATVYLGALQSSLQGSVQFILGKQQADKQADLVTKQIITEEKKTLDVLSTTAVRDTQSGKDSVIKDKQALDVVNQTTNRSAAQTTSENNAIQQRLLVINQAATELKKALDLVSATTVRNTQSTKDSSLKDAQKTKTDSETDVLSQKEITEYAQTQQTTKTAPNANSILGKQGTLYGEQAKGFKWNADQKYLKTLMDAWSINVSTAGVAATNITAINATGTGNLNTQITNAEPT
jgi:hypothetical protein